MSLFSTFKSLMGGDPDAAALFKLKELLDEKKKREHEWTEEERQMAEEATSFLRLHEDKMS